MNEEVRSRILYDNSGRVREGKSSSSTSFTIELSSDYLIVSLQEPEKRVHQVNLDDVIGARAFRDPSKGQNSTSVLHVYHYPRRIESSCTTSQKGRERKLLQLYFDAVEPCLKWANTIQSLSYKIPISELLESGRSEMDAMGGGREDVGSIKVAFDRKKYLVFVNPVSGNGTAVGVWERIVKPMFEESNSEYLCIVTERANHARDFVGSEGNTNGFDWRAFHAVVVIGGDGLLFEVVQGIKCRPDSEEVFRELPLAPIPGGTGNGLAKSIAFESQDEEFTAVESTFIALKGHSRAMDLGLVQTVSREYYSFLILGWGLISDIDILSETMRWMGEPRLYVAAVYFICKGASYAGRLSLILSQSSPLNNEGASNGADNNDYGSETLRGEDRDFLAGYSLPSIEEPFDQGLEGRAAQITVIEAEFKLVWVVQTSHASGSVYSGPGVTLDDGVFTVFVIRFGSRCEMMQLLIGIDNGDHLRHPRVETYKALAFRLEPKTEKGIYSLDGEVVEYGPIQGVVKPSYARVLSTHR